MHGPLEIVERSLTSDRTDTGERELAGVRSKIPKHAATQSGVDCSFEALGERQRVHPGPRIRTMPASLCEQPPQREPEQSPEAEPGEPELSRGLSREEQASEPLGELPHETPTKLAESKGFETDSTRRNTANRVMGRHGVGSARGAKYAS